MPESPRPPGEREPAPPDDELRAVLREIDAVLRPSRKRFEHLLRQIQGRNFGSPEQNRCIAFLVQQIADRLHVAFVCTKCSQPARLKCVRNRSVHTGVFTFSHTGGTHTGTAAVPALVLTEPRDDRRKRAPPPGPTPEVGPASCPRSANRSR